ncbi:MAG: hypothetical protein WC558_00320 [Patulibacter sp.]
MSIRRTGRTALAVLAAAASGFGFAGTSQAAAPWAPGPVHGDGSVSFPGDVAVSPDGGTTVVWTELPQWGTGARSIAYAQRTPTGGPPAPALPVSPPNANSVAAGVAATASGTTIVLTVDFNDPDDDHDDALRLTTIAADGSIAGALLVADEIDLVQEDGTQLAVDETGNALVTWIAGPNDDRRLHARRTATGGTLGPVLDFERVASSATPQVAFAPDGTARVAWIAGGLGRQMTVARMTTAGERDGTLERLSPAGVPTLAPRLSASAAGVAASWLQGGGSERELHTARLPSSGPVAAGRQLIASDAVSEAIDVSAAILLADDGALTASWPTRAGGPNTAFPLQTRTVTPDGSLGPVAALSDEPPADIAEVFPRLLETDDGSRYALWLRVGSGSGGGELRGREISPDGTPGVATVVTGGIAFGDRSPFAADVDALGNPVAGWLTASPDAPGASFATATLVRRTPPAIVVPDPPADPPPLVAPPIDGPPPFAAPPGVTPPPGRTPTVKASAGLRLGKVTRKGARVTVTGRLDRRASGRVTITWTQKLGRRTVKRSVRAKIVRGRFSATLRLPRTLAAARTRATVTVSYAGDGAVRAATQRKRVPRRAGA